MAAVIGMVKTEISLCFIITIHKDVTDRLEHINPSLAARARIVLDVNKSERHIRGGLATREKYQHRLAICSKQED